MNGRRQWWWLLMSAVLASCVASQPMARATEGCETEPEAASFEQLCEEDGTLLALCEQRQCGVYVCREVAEFLTAGHVVPTKGGGFSLPGAGLGVERYWGSAQGLPQSTRPVFIIPWGPSAPRELLPSQKQMLAEAEAFRKRPHEQHHIYSQAFRPWFTEKGINIDEYILLLEVPEHRRIHRGVNGGPWNEAWRVFIENNRGATPEEIHRHAGKLIYEFGLLGVVTPYRRWTPQPPPIQRY